ncbi:hypothetical protein J3A83DRAFT_4375454 [Scleroderma citrinum]
MELDKAKYDLVSRKLACLLDPFRLLRTVISVRLRVNSSHESELDMESEAITQQLCFYEGILKYVPGLADELSRMEVTDLQQICSWIMTGMSNQCSTDLRLVKHAGLDYMLHDGEVFKPSIPKTKDKSMHGFNHPQVTHLLCPQKKLGALEEDPDMIITALQEGLFNTSASNWPACFYEEEVYDPKNKLKGLFHSHAAHWFYTHLFIGPTAAAMDTCVSNASKPSKNHAWGLIEVTPYIIAYMHVVLYFTLSTVLHWCSVIGQMDLSELLWRIIELLDDKDNWTHETIAYWNMLFSKGAIESESEDDMAQIHAQCAGKMKTKCLSALEHYAAEAIEFRAPPLISSALSSSPTPLPAS